MKSINEILSLNSGLRDDHWEEEFLNSFPESKLYLLDENIQIGPDGWPYLFLTNDSSVNPKTEDKASNLVQWAYEQGVGLVINPNKEKPDYVFHYGMIWNYIHNKTTVKYGVTDLPPNSPIYVSKLSEDIVPSHALHFIKDYIKSAGIDSPRCALISRDKLNYDFAVSIESLGHPPKREHEGIAKGIGWFLPNHIPVVLIYEEKLQPLFEI